MQETSTAIAHVNRISTAVPRHDVHDAFGRFEEEGIFSPRAGRDFRDSVLANGGSVDYTDLFVRFRGRKPDPAALLRQSGIG